MEAQPQSALHAWHLEAGAKLQSFSGWQLPASYTEPSLELDQLRASVGISDASYLYKLDVRGPLPSYSSGTVWPLTPTHALLTSTRPISYVPSSSFVTDVSSVYSTILLAGPRSREVLQKLTTLNVRESALPEGAARQTRLAHVNATILRQEQTFLILNTRDVAGHVWEALLHAGAEFGARPFGMLAQQQWMGWPA